MPSRIDALGGQSSFWLPGEVRNPNIVMKPRASKEISSSLTLLIDLNNAGGENKVEDLPHLLRHLVEPLDFSAGVVFHLGHGEERHWENSAFVPQREDGG